MILWVRAQAVLGVTNFFSWALSRAMIRALLLLLQPTDLPVPEELHLHGQDPLLLALLAGRCCSRSEDSATSSVIRSGRVKLRAAEYDSGTG